MQLGIIPDEELILAPGWSAEIVVPALSLDHSTGEVREPKPGDKVTIIVRDAEHKLMRVISGSLIAERTWM